METVLNILIAEDNDDDAFLLRQAFKKAATTSRLNIVSDGWKALAYLNGSGVYSDRIAHPFPDFLLLDLNMPRMNGFEVLQAVRQDARCSRLVVHVLTASSRQADIQHAYDLGANSYILKPSRVDELVSFIRSLHEWHRFVCLPSPPSNKIEQMQSALFMMSRSQSTI